tara:strand:+ start:4055 stop:4717 length:663 start_codon:yes stop_codon:yes gene_type:complete
MSPSFAPKNSATFEKILSLEKKPIEHSMNDNKRKVLVDWMFEVSTSWSLFDDTIHYAVSYMDRYVSTKGKERTSKLQLLGVTCLWIASKFNEIYPPELDDFADVTDNTYTKKEIILKEADVLMTLNFELAKPTTKTFLMDYSDDEVCYQVDLSLMQQQKCLPSTEANNILKKRKRIEETEYTAVNKKYAKLIQKNKEKSIVSEWVAEWTAVIDGAVKLGA